MATPTLIADGVAALAIAGVYGYVARVFSARRIEHADARFAGRAFVTWWVGVAAVTGLIGGRSLLAGLELLTVELYETILVLIMLGVSVALWGVVYYLSYLHSGNTRWLVPVTAYHIALLVALVHFVSRLDPAGIDAKAWTIDAQYARPVEGGSAYALYLGILGPALIAAILYGALYFRTTDRGARYRIAVVSLSFILWFGATLVGGLLSLEDTLAYWPPVSRLIWLVAALGVIAAFRPPRWIRSKLSRQGAAL